MRESIDSAAPKPVRFRQVLAVGGFLCVLLLAYFGSVYYQVWHQANSDEARPADVIVVLGAAEYWGKPSPILKARLDHALELFNQQFAPRIITTGGHGLGSEFSEAAVAREYLSKHGVPAELISIEDAGESTMQSAAAVAEIMDRMKMTSCIVVSDGYHIHRIKNILEEQGIKVFGSPREPGNAGPWARGWLYARESLGYILWRFGIRV
jgi:uncharacterized SAM-binding protein YcdF (DUF218 family)